MKRGLKLSKQSRLHHFLIVRTQAPMKRGLKREVQEASAFYRNYVRTQAPMKRGLKLVPIPTHYLYLQQSEPRPR